MKQHLLKLFVLAGIIAIAGCDKGDKTAQPEQAPAPKEAAAPQAKPGMTEEIIRTTEATVTAINQETRQVTLQNAAGELVTFIAGDEVRNLAQGDAEVGVSSAAAESRAEPGEKPAGAAISETVLVVVIEAINKENETVTLKGPEGNSKTVKVRNPANLDKVAIGDKVQITYTESLAVVVTEK